jgi:hypothetical protein
MQVWLQAGMGFVLYTRPSDLIVLEESVCERVALACELGVKA